MAESLFAEKGFDGARVDEIAGRAGVNKALIYYYFKSKQSILDEIYREFQEEIVNLLLQYVNEEIDFNDEKRLNDFFNLYIAYLETRKDVLRIMLAESLKSSEEKPEILHMMEVLIEREIEPTLKAMREKGFNVAEEKSQLMVTEFFTGVMPVVNYIVFKDTWSKHFGIKQDTLKELFFNSYRATHIQYHLASQ